MRFTGDFDRYWIPEPNSGCWLWFGACNENGYGLITREKKNVKAHRFAYEREHGPIGQGLEVDHLCRNKSCVNPDHLEVVTHGENRKRVLRELRFACVQCGVTVLRKHKRHVGEIRCRTCIHRNACARYYERNR